MITPAVLRAAIPGASAADIERYAPHLEAARVRFVGDDPAHVAMWLAQLAHESGSLKYSRELASGAAYEGRLDLGNTSPGDGPRFRGRGLIQLTGRDNYRRAGAALGLPLEDQPELLEQPEQAAMSAGWFWHWARCAWLMDEPDPLLAVTKRINGGTNGLEDRRTRYAVALAAVRSQPAGPLAPAGSSPPAEAPAPAAPAPPPPAPPPYVDPMRTPEEAAADAAWQRLHDAATPTVTPATRPAMPLPAAAAISLASELLKLLPFAQRPDRADQVDKIGATLLQIAQQVAPQAVNEQQAVEQVRSNPQVRSAFVARAVEQWSDISPALEFDAEQRKEARTYLRQMTETGPQWRQVGAGALVGVLSLTIILGGGAMFWSLMSSPQLDPGQKGLILGALLSVFSSTAAYWFGSSASSRQKDQTISEQARK